MHTHTQNNRVVEVHQRREKEAKEQIELKKKLCFHSNSAAIAKVVYAFA